MQSVRRLFLSLAITSIATASSAESLSTFEGCFVRSYPRIGAGNIAEIRVVVRPTPKEGPVFDSYDAQVGKTTSSIDISYRFWELPNVAFGIENFRCPRIGGKIVCGIECGGGSISVSPLLKGDLLVEARKLLAANGGVSSLLLVDDADSFSMKGTHTLKRVEPAQCEGVGQSSTTGGIVLQQGDYHPYVRRITTQLAKLGYLANSSTSLFTPDVTSALKAFQEKFRLEPTGIADPATMRLLNVRAIVEGGC